MKTIDNAMFTKMFLASWKAAKAANAAVAAMAAEAGIGIPDYSLPEKNARLNVLLQLKMNDEAEVPASKKAQKKETPEWIIESVKNVSENVSVEDSVKEVLATPLDDLDEELDKFFAEEPESEPEPKVSPVAKIKAKKVKKTAKKEVKKEAKPALSPYERIKASIAAKRAELSGSTKEVREVKPASATKKVKKAEAKIIKVDPVPESKETVVSIDGTGKYHDEIDKALDSVGKDLTIEVPFVMTANGFVRGKAVVAAAIKKGIKNIVVSASGFDDADKEVRENVTALVDKLEASGKVSVKFVKAKTSVVKKAAKPVAKTNAPKKGSLLSRISSETETETIALSDISVSDVDMDIIAS